MRITLLIYCFLTLITFNVTAKTNKKPIVYGTILNDKQEPLSGAEIFIAGKTHIWTTNKEGKFEIHGLDSGKYVLNIFAEHYQSTNKSIVVNQEDIHLQFDLIPVLEIKEVVIEEKRAEKESFGSGHLKSVEGTSIYESKKTETVKMDEIVANKSANKSREVYSKVAGLNIWESDCAGLQLDIGGRGLSPSRTASFNVRQNGYDISADALGYPESYYTPPAELVDQIDIVRGAASLQYGTQIGGMINYKVKTAPEDKEIELVTRQSVGSYGFLNSSNLVAGTVNKFSYVAYYQHKSGRGCDARPNSDFNYDLAYTDLSYQFTKKLKVAFQYTYMTYLAQQAGGLTDRQFEQDATQSNRERNWFNVKWNLPALIIDYKFNNRTKLSVNNFALIASRDALGNLTPPDKLYDGGDRNLIKGRFENIGQETRVIHKYKLAKKEHVLGIGYRLYKGYNLSQQGDASDNSDADFHFINSPDSLDSDYDNPSFNAALYAENIIWMSEKWSITPGVRVEYISTKSNGYWKEELVQNGTVLETIFHEEDISRSRSLALFGLGTSYRFKKSELYANFSQNYKSITFSDLRISNPSFAIDPNLKDERGFNLDLGVRGTKFKYLRYDASAFLLYYYDRIGEVYDWSDFLKKLVRVRTNVADSRNIGVECLVEWQVLKQFLGDSINHKVNLFAKASFIDARYINSSRPGIEGNKVELVPPYTIKTGINYKYKRLSAGYLFSYVKQHFSDANNTEFSYDGVSGDIPTYWVMDLSFAYEFKKYFRLETGVNNITNNSYFTRRATGYPGPGIIPAGLRSMYFTLQVKL